MTLLVPVACVTAVALGLTAIGFREAWLVNRSEPVIRPLAFDNVVVRCNEQRFCEAVFKLDQSDALMVDLEPGVFTSAPVRVGQILTKDIERREDIETLVSLIRHDSMIVHGVETLGVYKAFMDFIESRATWAESRAVIVRMFRVSTPNRAAAVVATGLGLGLGAYVSVRYFPPSPSDKEVIGYARTHLGTGEFMRRYFVFQGYKLGIVSKAAFDFGNEIPCSQANELTYQLLNSALNDENFDVSGPISVCGTKDYFAVLDWLWRRQFILEKTGRPPRQLDLRVLSAIQSYRTQTHKFASAPSSINRQNRYGEWATAVFLAVTGAVVLVASLLIFIFRRTVEAIWRLRRLRRRVKKISAASQK